MAIQYTKDKDWRMKVSVSKQCYEIKPIRDEEKDKYPEGTPTISSIRWVEANVSIDEFADLIERGGCFCGLFYHSGNYISRSKQKFKAQWYIGIDCDNMVMDFDEFLPRLPIPPTIAYRTPSDGVGGNRYRLIYFTDAPLATEQEVKGKYIGLLEELGIENLIKDNCGGQCNRYFNGAYSRKPVVNYTILQTDTIPCVVVETEKPAPKHRERKAVQDDLPVDPKFLNDFRTMKYSQFLLEYCQYGGYRVATQLDFDPNTGIAYLPDDYVEIKPIYRKGVLKKAEDGHRHKVLTVTALKLLKVNDGMTMEQLIYAIAQHAVENIDLSDGKVTPETILGIAQWAMKRRDTISVKQDKRKFRVSQEIAMEQGKTIQKLIGEETTRQKDAEIAPYFNPLLTDKGNVAVMKEKGISVSVDFLRGYRHRHDCTLSNARLSAIRDMYNEKKKDKEIMDTLGISKPTLYKYKRIVKSKKS